jgi:hypothetical protein
MKTWLPHISRVVRENTFPEQLLRETPWATEWSAQIRARNVRVTTYALLSTGTLWMLHYPFVDVPLNSLNNGRFFTWPKRKRIFKF